LIDLIVPPLTGGSNGAVTCGAAAGAVDWAIAGNAEPSKSTAMVPRPK
jgi:hypothetical protein